jgi:hypothetical protein
MKKYKNYINYFNLNKYVGNLKKIKVKEQKNSRTFFQNADSISILILHKIYVFLRALWKYFPELFIGYKYLIRIFFVKKIKKKDYCIIFGNGPSLDSLKINELKKISLFFDIFVVNNFIQNKLFYKIIPNFFLSSDPRVFTKNNYWSKKAESKLAFYLKNNPNISIFTPVLQCKRFLRIFGRNKIFGFIDTEARILSENILPILPRGYLSITTMKAICIANWMGYKKIFLLGVDNTYARNFFLNKKNDILTLENYSKRKDFVYDQTSYYRCLSKAMFEQYQVYKDYKKINKKNNIYNLDQYSLTGYDKSYNIKRLLKKLSKKATL